MKKLHFDQVKGKGAEITDAIIATEEVASCEKDFFALHLVCEELAVNIADYAYPEGKNGYLDVLIDKTPNEIAIMSLVFRSLIMVCLDMDFFRMILFNVHLAS